MNSVARKVAWDSQGNLVEEDVAQELRIALMREGVGLTSGQVFQLLKSRAIDYARSQSLNSRSVVRQYREAGDDAEKIHALKQAGVYKINVYSDTVQNEDGESHSIIDHVTDDASSGFRFVDNLHSQDQLRAIDRLLDSPKINPRHAKAFRMYYGLNGDDPKTYSQIGLEVGLTESRIFQIVGKVREQLAGLVDGDTHNISTHRPDFVPSTRTRVVQERKKERVVGGLREILSSVSINGNTSILEKLDLDKKLIKIRVTFNEQERIMLERDKGFSIEGESATLTLNTNVDRDKDTVRALLASQGQELALRYLLIYRQLSNKERFVVRHLYMQDKQIALKMGINDSTARTHIHKIYQRTGWNAEQLTSFAVALHFVKPPETGINSDEFTDDDRSIYFDHVGGMSDRNLARKLGVKVSAAQYALADIYSRLDEQDVKLSEREQEVLTQYCAGLKYEEIAQHFTLSVSTVRTHIHNLYKKLGVTYKRELDVAAYGHGFVELEAV